MKLDVKALGRQAWGDLREKFEPKAKELGPRADAIRVRFDRLEADTQATLEALERETDPARAAALVQDLEEILPARRTFLLAAVEAELGSAAKAFLDAALEVGVRVALAVARAFVPLP